MQIKKWKKIILITISSLVLAFLIFLAVITFNVVDSMTERHINFSKLYNASDYGLEAKHLFLKTEDNINISAYEVELEQPKAVIICLSGIENPSVTAYFGHAKWFKENNYATVLVEMRSHGESDGNRICLGYKEDLDVAAAVDYIKSKAIYQDKPIVVMGVSMGASVAINAIGENSDIDGLISLSAYSSYEEVFYKHMAEEISEVAALPSIPMVHLATYLKFDEDSNKKPKNQIKKIGERPALLIHSRDDSQIAFENFDRLLQNAPLTVETMVVAGDKHMIVDDFSNPQSDVVYSKKIMEFLNNNF